MAPAWSISKGFSRKHGHHIIQTGSIQHHSRFQEKFEAKLVVTIGAGDILGFLARICLYINTNWVKCQPRINPSRRCLSTLCCSLIRYTCFLSFMFCFGHAMRQNPSRNAILPISTICSHMFLNSTPCLTRWNTMLDPSNIQTSLPPLKLDMANLGIAHPIHFWESLPRIGLVEHIPYIWGRKTACSKQNAPLNESIWIHFAYHIWWWLYQP